jgi:hypothetical protein
MRHATVLAAITALAAAAGAHAQTAGLDVSVFHNIPATDYYPTDVSFERNYALGATPDYTFVNTNDGFQYSNPPDYTNGATTTAYFLGADAAGAALTDTASNDNTSIDQTGSLVITTPGEYTFDLAEADDAARVYLSGAPIVENDFPGGLDLPAGATETLAAGDYGFELFSYQAGGDAFVSFDVTGPGAVSFITTSVPEPAAWTTMLIGLALVGAGLRRRRGGLQPA